MKNYRKILRNSYGLFFLLQTIIMVIVKIIFDFFLESEIDFIEILIFSSVFGLVMSLIMVSIFRRNQKEKIER